METFADGLAGEFARQGELVTLVAETPLGTFVELERPYSIIRSPYMRRALLQDADVLVANGPSIKLLRSARQMHKPRILIHQAPAGACPIGIGWRNESSCNFSPLKCIGCRVSDQSTLSNLKSIARLLRLRMEMNRSTKNVYVSEYMASRTAWCPGAVIANFFDESIFKPATAGIAPLHFLFVGRLVSTKGADIAIRALAIARHRGLNHRLRIVGDGPERANLEQIALAEGVANDVDFLGGRRGHELARLFQSSYALLFPSQWEEPFGIVMAEAMGCGCPVIASAHGACPEVVGDAGILLPPADPDAWAAAMLTLAQDRDRRDALSNRATDRAGRLFAPESVANQYLEILRSAVDSAMVNG